MSGIYGIFSRNQLNIPLDLLSKWNQPYGRDKAESISKENFSAGCFYERITNQGEISSMIFHSEKDCFLSDVLLYNRDELLPVLSAVSACSDEVLIHQLVKAKGFTYLKNVNGDFAGAYYHKETNSLTLFRDHLGIRPLYYYANGDYVIFSTDIRGLLSLEIVDATPRKNWIMTTIVAGSDLSPTATEYEHIHCVMPGSTMTFSFENEKVAISTQKYWELGQHKIKKKNFEEYKNGLRECIEDSIKRRLDIVDGPIGSELSGGLDSGAISILINRFGREGIYYSWSPDPAEIPYVPKDERLIIKDICEQENITCHYTGLETDFSKDCTILQSFADIHFPVTEESLHYKYGFTPSVSTVSLAKSSDFARKNGAKVIFTGHGGDEGVSHRSRPYELYYHKEYLAFLKHYWSISYGRVRKIPRFLKKLYHFAFHEKQQFHESFSSGFHIKEFVTPEFLDEINQYAFPNLEFSYDPIAYINHGGSRNRLELVSMYGAYSQVRFMVPYLDYRVVDYAVSIPRYLYLKGHLNRYIFREAFRDIFPDSLYTLKIKSNESNHALGEDPDWNLSFQKCKEETYSILKNNHWENYLDLKKVEEFVHKDFPKKEERCTEDMKLTLLALLAMSSNAVDKARSLDSKKS